MSFGIANQLKILCCLVFSLCCTHGIPQLSLLFFITVACKIVGIIGALWLPSFPVPLLPQSWRAQACLRTRTKQQLISRVVPSASSSRLPARMPREQNTISSVCADEHCEACSLRIWCLDHPARFLDQFVCVPCMESPRCISCQFLFLRWAFCV